MIAVIMFASVISDFSTTWIYINVHSFDTHCTQKNNTLAFLYSNLAEEVNVLNMLITLQQKLDHKSVTIIAKASQTALGIN